MDQIFKQNIKSQLGEKSRITFSQFPEGPSNYAHKAINTGKQKTFEFPYSKGHHK